MSRNFELLKRAEEERKVRTVAASTSAVDSIDVHRPLRPLPSEARSALPKAPVDAARPGLPGSASVDINKLVQNIFVLPAIAAPRVVIFSPVTRNAHPDFVSARAAEAVVDLHLGSVAFIDADVIRPSAHAYFSVPNAVGFTDVLDSREPLQTFAHGVAGCELTVLTAGQPTHNWQTHLVGEVVTERLRDLRSQYDFIIINAPPVSECPTVVALGQRSDGVVLVIEANDTKRDVAVRAKQQWERANTRLLGAVLNNRTFPIPDSLYAKL